MNPMESPLKPPIIFKIIEPVLKYSKYLNLQKIKLHFNLASTNIINRTELISFVEKQRSLISYTHGSLELSYSEILRYSIFENPNIQKIISLTVVSASIIAARESCKASANHDSPEKARAVAIAAAKDAVWDCEWDANTIFEWDQEWEKTYKAGYGKYIIQDASWAATWKVFRIVSRQKIEEIIKTNP